MDFRKNENGYALIIVLLLIVFVTIVSATFMRGSISNAKQEQIVDTNNLAVAAAEMGVDYYTRVINNEYIKIQPSLTELASKELSLAGANPKQTAIDSIRLVLAEKLKTDIGLALDLAESSKLVSDDLMFSKMVISAESSKDKVEFIGEVLGVNNNGDKERTLNFEMTFTIPNIDIKNGDDEGSGGSDTGEFGDINLDNLYPDNITAPSCGSNLKNTECIGDLNTKIENSDNSTIYFPSGYKDKNNNNMNLKGSKIYSNAGITFEKNINSMQNVDFFIDGEFNAKNMNGTSNSNIIVNGSMTAGQLDLSNSSIIVRGAVKIMDHLTLSNNSKVCVAGSLDIVKHLNMDNSSKIYIFGSINKPYSSNVIPVDSVAQLVEKCSGSGDNMNNPTFDNDWKDPDVNVGY